MVNKRDNKYTRIISFNYKVQDSVMNEKLTPNNEM